MCLPNLSLRRSSHRGVLIVPCSYLKTRANHANEVSEKPFLAFYKLAFCNYYGPQFIFFCVYESVSVEMNVSLSVCMLDCIYLSLNCETLCNTVF